MLTVKRGDCRLALEEMILFGDKVDSVITDPPYGLTSITKRFGSKTATAAKVSNNDGSFARLSKGFMGTEWDGSGIERDSSFWKLVFEVMKDGAFCLAFSSPRTGHRQACAMEDAGFIMHPFLGWMYGSGFPKQHKVDVQIIKTLHDADEAGKWKGWGYGAQALKPALEPIYFAQKPYSNKSPIRSIVENGVGGLNIDACRTDAGRHPANLLHDASDAVEACFPYGKSGKPTKIKKEDMESNSFGSWHREAGTPMIGYGDEGSTSRFFNSFPFYHPKATKTDRHGSNHPTVKPVGLIEWLCRLITPEGGTVLDPFAGTGTTGEAARTAGFNCILMEANPEYCSDIERRFAL